MRFWLSDFTSPNVNYFFRSLGAPFNTLLLIGAALICLDTMLFGVRVMGDH